MQLHLPHADAPPAAPKSAEILHAIRTAFIEKGFDGASMQDLARAAGMSVGNFYRYFPSKDAIVAQMIALDMTEIEAEFARVLQSAHPMDALRTLIEMRIWQNHTDQKGQLWAEISAAAQRKPDIAECACQMETTVSTYLLQVFAAETGLPLALIEQRFAAHAGFIMLLVKSTAMTTPQNAAPTPDLNPLILRTINQLLDEISGKGSKG
jgi:AcrR family transcriptional regulator